MPQNYRKSAYIAHLLSPVFGNAEKYLLKNAKY